jgi:hypothetical protein
MHTIILYTEPRTGQIRGYVRLAGGGEFATACPTHAALADAVQALRRSGEAHSISLDRNPIAYQADRKPAE